jgi:hypothetical protein
MTNFRQVRNNRKRGGNRKDGHRPDRRQIKAQRQTAEDQWIKAGFNSVDWNKWTYTWPGNFPVFQLAPGIVTNDQGTRAGMVARYPKTGKEILFSYGTPPVDIKAQLDDEIFAIMQHDATIDELPLDWQSSVEEIDIDEWMVAE